MKGQGNEFPVVIGQTGPLNGQSWAIDKDLTIGRDEDCAIIIQDRQVSRVHARLAVEKDGIKLEDLASKNGTYVNGKLIIAPAFLQDGDVFQIALIQGFVFLSADATMPLKKQELITVERRGKLYLDSRSRRVWIGEKEIDPPLSAPQFRLLQALYNSQGRVVARADLILAVWEDEEALGISEQALDALIRRLRDRLRELDTTQNYLVTVRGHGLRLDNLPE